MIPWAAGSIVHKPVRGMAADRKRIKMSLQDEFRNMLIRERATETGKIEGIYHICGIMTKTLI
jgi:hypothetical protein